MRAENVVTMLVVLAAVTIGIIGLQVGKQLYVEGQEVGVAVCEVRIERMVRDVDSLTVLVREYESEVTK